MKRKQKSTKNVQKKAAAAAFEYFMIIFIKHLPSGPEARSTSAWQFNASP